MAHGTLLPSVCHHGYQMLRRNKRFLSLQGPVKLHQLVSVASTA
jgi:hypothetical protein